MAAYIALKPCKFGNTPYLKGSSIPAGKVMVSKADALIKMGIIAPSIEAVSVPMTEIKAAEAPVSAAPKTPAEKPKIAKNKV